MAKICGLQLEPTLHTGSSTFFIRFWLQALELVCAYKSIRSYCGQEVSLVQTSSVITLTTI